jgi:hypothetical protein
MGGNVNRRSFWQLIITVLLLLGVVNPTPFRLQMTGGAPPSTIDRIAESYVKLVLAVGQHDSVYVDAYYGPGDWLREAREAKASLREIRRSATTLLRQLTDIGSAGSDETSGLRHQYLTQHLKALIVRVETLDGRKLTFDEESRGLYDAVAPVYPESRFKALVKKLEALLPGNGNLEQRYERFRKQFAIPPENLDTVFTTAIEECRRRTKQHIDLPAHESFRMEYVTGTPWGAYNWYKGKANSVIQVNTDLPIYIDAAIRLVAHEGYPGHHVYNALLELNLSQKRNWVEFTVYPLFSPMSLIAEGSANYGVDVAFTKEERLAFARDVLCPLAGLKTTRIEQYYKVQELLEGLSYAENEAARGYLDGTMSREAAIQWLMKYRLKSRERAERELRFIERYRSYVINYNMGKDLVRRYVESRGGTADNPDKKWKEFSRLLSLPLVPSSLR